MHEKEHFVFNFDLCMCFQVEAMFKHRHWWNRDMWDHHLFLQPITNLTKDPRYFHEWHRLGKHGKVWPSSRDWRLLLKAPKGYYRKAKTNKDIHYCHNKSLLLHSNNEWDLYFVLVVSCHCVAFALHLKGTTCPLVWVWYNSCPQLMFVLGHGNFF